MKKIKELLFKYKSFIMYAIFGVCTTLLNWASYYLFYNIAGIPNVPSTIIAWVLAVAFAFITNKLWVFESRSFEKKILLHEIWTFTAARLATGILDVGIMYLTVDVLGWNSTLWKLLSNIVVIILNYVLSKLVVFKKGRSGQSQKD